MIRQLRYFLRYFFRRRHFEDELNEELRSSFELIVERNVERGLTPEAARRATRMEFEDLEQIKEGIRDRMTGAGVYSFLQDIRYGWRGLRQSPSFAWISLGAWLFVAMGLLFHLARPARPPAGGYDGASARRGGG